MSLTARPATQREHDRLVKLARTSKYTADFSNHIFSGEAAYKKGWIGVAVEDETGEIVGMYCVRHKVRAPETVLYFITVDPKRKGQGIGQLLISNIQAVSPHCRIVLNVANTNTEALAFYERLGFSRVGPALEGTGVQLVKEWVKR